MLRSLLGSAVTWVLVNKVDKELQHYDTNPLMNEWRKIYNRNKKLFGKEKCYLVYIALLRPSVHLWRSWKRKRERTSASQQETYFPIKFFGGLRPIACAVCHALSTAVWWCLSGSVFGYYNLLYSCYLLYLCVLSPFLLGLYLDYSLTCFGLSSFPFFRFLFRAFAKITGHVWFVGNKYFCSDLVGGNTLKTRRCMYE